MFRSIASLLLVATASLGSGAWSQPSGAGAHPFGHGGASAMQAAPAATTAPANGLRGSTILIVRHAEKPADGTGLTPAGEARAAAYASYFRSFRFRGAMLRVDTLVAAADTDHSARSRLTLIPLSQATAIPVQQPYPSANVGELASWLRAGPARRTILVSWHHGQIGRLVEALGADPRRILSLGWWPPSVYDWVVVLRFDAQGAFMPSSSGLVKEHIVPPAELAARQDRGVG